MLEKLKEDVCRIAKQAQAEGLCKYKSGNFSARDKETGYVAVTPSGVDRDFLSARDIIIMDMDFNVIENLANLVPTSEVLVHIEIYRVRPECLAIAHTHSKYATAFAVVGKPIPAIVFEMSVLGLKESEIPIAPYHLPGTIELAHLVAKTTLKSDSVLMERHGVICAGKDVDDAYLKAAYVEEMAEIYLSALVLNNGKNPKIFAQEEYQQHKYPKEIKL